MVEESNRQGPYQERIVALGYSNTLDRQGSVIEAGFSWPIGYCIGLSRKCRVTTDGQAYILELGLYKEGVVAFGR